MTKKINPQKLTSELQSEGLPVAGVSSSGRLDFTRDLSKSEQSKVDQVLFSHDPDPSPEEQRLIAYSNAGITSEKLLFALWRELKNGLSDEANSLSSLMKSIDDRI
jgi:hypothetical protein